MLCSFSGDPTRSGKDGTAEEFINFIPGKQFTCICMNNNLLNLNLHKHTRG